MPRVIHGNCPIPQGDAYFSQADPVSTTLYEWRDEATAALLGTQKNVRIISACATVTFGAGAPTPLEIIVTANGIPQIYFKNNPATGAAYLASTVPKNSALTQADMTAQTGAISDSNAPYLLEGRSVKVEARITWAVQPTPLDLRVKWARIP